MMYGKPVQSIMKTVIEHPTFQRQAASIWSEPERHAFIDWIAQNPTAGDVMPGAEGARKVPWMVQGRRNPQALDCFAAVIARNAVTWQSQ